LQLTFVEPDKAAEISICFAETMEEKRTDTPPA
jgi:hypothetical protein